MGQAIPITRTDYSTTQLRGLAARSDDAEQARRLLAIALILDGQTRTEAAEICGMQRQTLRDWVHRYNESGIEGLKSRTAPGPQPLLNDVQKAELKALVIAGPEPGKHKVVRWRCLDLRDEVRRRFDVSVDERTIGKWLHQLGLRRLQPRPFNPQKDAAAQEAYKKTSPIW